jgi:hypothetical protein
VPSIAGAAGRARASLNAAEPATPQLRWLTLFGSVPFFLTLALAHPGVVSHADAHPAPEMLGQRFEVQLAQAETGADALKLQVVYKAEVPERRVLTEVARLPAVEAKSYAANRLADLAGAIKARWNDAPVELKSVPVEHAASTGEAGFEFKLDLQATLPGRTGTLSLVNGNFPDETCFFATQVTLPGDLVVTRTSLAGVSSAGLLTGSTHGAWTRDEHARDVTVSVAPAGYWERKDGDFPLPERLRGLTTLSTPRWVLAVAAVTIGIAATLVALRFRPRSAK